MAWIESHQSIGRHPKTIRLARALGVSKFAAIGYLHMLWWWALDYAQDGDLSRYTVDEIEAGAEWDGEPGKFVDALIQAGYVDDDMAIHDWYDYAGKLFDRREKDKTRKQDMRRAYQDGTIDAVRRRDGDTCRYCGTTVDWSDRKTGKGGTYDHIDPDGPTTADNLVVSCRSCNAAKGHRKPEEAGMWLLPPRGKRTPNSTSSTALNVASNDHLTTLPNQPNQPKKIISSSSDTQEIHEGTAAVPEHASPMPAAAADPVDPSDPVEAACREIEVQMTVITGRTWMAKDSDYRLIKSLVASGVPVEFITAVMRRVVERNPGQRISRFAYFGEAIKEQWALELARREPAAKVEFEVHTSPGRQVRDPPKTEIRPGPYVPRDLPPEVKEAMEKGWCADVDAI